MCIAANTVKGIRAAVCSDTFSARFTRMHNNANILCLGGRVVGLGLALELVEAYLSAEFEGGRHQRRIDPVSYTHLDVYKRQVQIPSAIQHLGIYSSLVQITQSLSLIHI